jgi:GNAT superfamily N-acetyltransferase
MSADDHLSGIQFGHSENELNHQIWATNHRGEEIGHLHWSKEEREADDPEEYTGDPGVISMIEVHPDYRRKGIATAMFNQAQQYRPKPLHSDDRSYEGDQWARKVGGPTIYGTDVRDEPEVPEHYRWDA